MKRKINHQLPNIIIENIAIQMLKIKMIIKLKLKISKIIIQ